MTLQQIAHVEFAVATICYCLALSGMYNFFIIGSIAACFGIFFGWKG